ncbi:MAG: ral secretion pathway protein, partial [Armatimonadetes bacterium]|nr:ral secretion pathway protein [Armatimonadota bacterium]
MTRFIRLFSALALVAGVLTGAVTSATAQGNSPLVIVPKQGDPNQMIAFSFQQADIDDVLRFLADVSGKIVFKDSSVVTSITIRNQSRISVAQAIRLVQTILSLKGYALTETEDALIVTSTQEAIRKRSTKVTVGKDLASIPKGKEIITHVFPLENVDAVRLREELNPIFAGGTTQIIANGDTNSLIVVDEADVVRRIAQLVTLMDRDLTDSVNVTVVRLQYADANEVARYLTDLFRPEPQDRPQQNQGGGPGGQGAAAQPRSSSLAALRGRVRFAADQRSNSLIVYASPANMKAINEIIAQIDVNLAPRTEYRIIELQYADATALSDQLNQLVDPNARAGGAGRFFGFGGFGGGGANTMNTDRGLQDYKIVPDVRTNSLIVTAPVDAIESVERLAQQLDKPSQVRDVVRVIQLQNAIASEVATTLRNLFLGTQGQGGGLGFGLFGQGGRTQIPPGSPLDLLRQVTIVPNDQTNQLLISGPAQTFPVIESLLTSGDNGLDRRLPQVFIEVVIADITLDDIHKFGVEWNAVAGNSSLGTNFGLNDPLSDTTGFRYSIVSKGIQATVQALNQQNKVKVVSTPHVMVTDNSPAVITIGERIPYAGQTSVTAGISTTETAFEDVSITLNVTPHISPGNNILMDIDQVVNSLIEFIEISPGQLAPRTTNRRAGTTVIVADDQTVVLGGIISNDDKRNTSRVPILSQIPLIGNLFKNTTRSQTRTELVVFITPHIVRENKDAEPIRAYERERLQVDPLKILQAPFKKPFDPKVDEIFERRRRGSAKPESTPEEK